MNRRAFVRAGLCGASVLLSSGCRAPHLARRVQARFFFTSQGRTGLIYADGSGLRYFDFRQPNQVTWQPGPFFSDGRSVILLSMEARRDGPGRPFDQYYTQTPTHLWKYHLDRDELVEIATRERRAVFYTPALLLSDERILVQVVRERVGQIFSMNLNGTDARPFTREGEGLPYGLSLSPDRQRVAYHLASPRGYEIWTSDLEGANRVRVAGHPDHLYFGTSWSPDGRWILYQDCHFKSDPGHDWSDLCLGRPDGSQHRVVTSGQLQWFGATYGGLRNRGGGSNMPMWNRDGTVLFSRRVPQSKVPWEYQVHRPDTDHFNREFKPELARGGTEICRLDPNDGSMHSLTPSVSGRWDFRAAESPDGSRIVFCRAATGEAPAIWIMNHDGSEPRRLTAGLEEQGADHPRWLPPPDRML
jgi:Tol biopolymer transport system component